WRALHEEAQAVGKQHALRDVNGASADEPRLATSSQRVLTLADQRVLLAFVAIAVDQELAAGLHFLRALRRRDRSNDAYIRDEVHRARNGFLCPVHASLELRNAGGE